MNTAQYRYKWIDTEIIICVYIIHFLVLPTVRGPRSSDTPVAMNTASVQPWFLIYSSSKRNQSSLEKLLILREGQGKYKMSLEHFVVLESKEVLKNKRMGTCQRDTEINLKELPTAKVGTT